MKWVYLIKNLNTGNHKVGFSKNPENRVLELQTGSDSCLELAQKIKVINYSKVESALKLEYTMKNKLKKGEWFELGENDINDFERKVKLYDSNFETIKQHKKNKSYWI